MTERAQLILGALILLISSCMALRKEEFPLIQSNPQACWKHSGVVPANLHVCDPDGLVSDLDAMALQKAVMTLSETTRCPCHTRRCHVWDLQGRTRGYTMSIALVQSMNVSINNKVEAARDYVEYLRKNRQFYGVNFSSRCQEDIILFLSSNDKAIYVLTGSKARERVSDGELSNIINKSKPEFASSLAQGLQFVVEEIGKELKN